MIDYLACFYVTTDKVTEILAWCGIHTGITSAAIDHLEKPELIKMPDDLEEQAVKAKNRLNSSGG